LFDDRLGGIVDGPGDAAIKDVVFVLDPLRDVLGSVLECDRRQAVAMVPFVFGTIVVRAGQLTKANRPVAFGIVLVGEG